MRRYSTGQSSRDSNRTGASIYYYQYFYYCLLLNTLMTHDILSRELVLVKLAHNGCCFVQPLVNMHVVEGHYGLVSPAVTLGGQAGHYPTTAIKEMR